MTKQERVKLCRTLAKAQEKYREGEKYGKWTVGARVGKRGSNTYYTCTCECGTILDVAINALLRGHSTQCKSCASKRPICVKGHDTSLYGRNSGGVCRVCTKANSIKYKYGITMEEYKALYKLQDGKCAICKKPMEFIAIPEKRGTSILGRVEIDHKHYTKKQIKKMPNLTKKSTVRGLLCGGRYAGCNAKLGHVDNVEWLRAAAVYLENPPAQQILKESTR